MSHSFKLMIIMLFTSSYLYSGGVINPPEDANAKDIVRDVVVVHGMTLKGRVTKLGPDKLSFRLVYCDGVNHIAYKDIDSLVTKYKYQISYDRKEVVGRVLGLVDREFLRVELSDKTILIKIADIDNFVMSVQDDDSVENRIRNRVPYTSGNMNFGVEFEDGINDKVKADLMMNWWHKKAGNELHFYVDYAYETTATEETEKVQNKDELTAILTNRYFYRANDFYFVSMMGEFDRPRHIQSRYVPAVGYGHRFRKDKNQWLQPVVGLAYVSTRYTDENLYPDNRFTAGAIGLNGKYQLDDVAIIGTLVIDGGTVYYPSISDPQEDWISRSNLNFTIPLFDFISMKLAIQWINDSNPDIEVGNNKTTTNLYFGIDF